RVDPRMQVVPVQMQFVAAVRPDTQRHLFSLMDLQDCGTLDQLAAFYHQLEDVIADGRTLRTLSRRAGWSVHGQGGVDPRALRAVRCLLIRALRFEKKP